MVDKIIQKIKYKVKYYLYTKKQYYCPLCDTYISTFYPFDGELLYNYKKYNCFSERFKCEFFSLDTFSCPKCGGMDRERLVGIFIKNLFNDNPTPSSLKILEVAPTKQIKNFLSKYKIKHETVDKYINDVDYQCDITNMNIIASKSYDMWICLHVLEHVDNDIQALNELYRILKPGGLGVLLAPISLRRCLHKV